MANVNQRQKGFSKEQSKIRGIAIAMMLKNGQTISTSQILRKLKLQYGMTVDRKTIYSDMYAINMFIPIEVVPGRYGGYRKVDVLGGCDGTTKD